MEKTLLILAAGLGSRFGGLKQMSAFGPSGETIMDYSIYDAIRVGFTKVVIVIRKEFEAQFWPEIERKYGQRVHLECVYQELDDLPSGYSLDKERQKPWGTGHAVWSARNVINEPFVVINADDFYGAESFEVLSHFFDEQRSSECIKCGLVGFQLANTLSENGGVSRGICETDTDGQLIHVEERTGIQLKDGRLISNEDGQDVKFNLKTPVSMNLTGFPYEAFAVFEEEFRAFLEAYESGTKAEFYLPSVVNTIANSENGEVHVLKTTDRWFGVTYREDLPSVQKAIQELVSMEKYPKNLFQDES